MKFDMGVDAVRKHEYERRLDRMFKGGIISPAMVDKVDVEHDSRCPYVNKGACTCDPYVTIIMVTGERYGVRKDGTLTTWRGRKNT